MINHRGALNTIEDINRRFAVDRADRVLGLSSLSFDLSVWDIFGTLAAGGTLVLPSVSGRRDPAHWATLCRETGITIWNSVPALMSAMLDYADIHPDHAGTKLRLAMLSGDWIPVSMPDRIRSRYPATSVVSLGGATEASIWSILYPIGDVDPGWTSIPYGRSMSNQSVVVLNGSLVEVPDWVAGELYIGGVGVAEGYWRDTEKTAAKFVSDGRPRSISPRWKHRVPRPPGLSGQAQRLPGRSRRGRERLGAASPRPACRRRSPGHRR